MIGNGHRAAQSFFILLALMAILTSSLYVFLPSAGRPSPVVEEVASPESDTDSGKPYEFRPAGQGGPELDVLPKETGGFLKNKSSQTLVVFAAVLDVDPLQQKIYFQLRYDISPGDERLISFLGWESKACYVPVLVFPRSPSALERLAGLQREDIPSKAQVLTADGDVEIDYLYDRRFCVD